MVIDLSPVTRGAISLLTFLPIVCAAAPIYTSAHTEIVPLGHSQEQAKSDYQVASSFLSGTSGTYASARVAAQDGQLGVGGSAIWITPRGSGVMPPSLQGGNHSKASAYWNDTLNFNIGSLPSGADTYGQMSFSALLNGQGSVSGGSTLGAISEWDLYITLGSASTHLLGVKMCGGTAQCTSSDYVDPSGIKSPSGAYTFTLPVLLNKPTAFSFYLTGDALVSSPYYSTTAVANYDVQHTAYWGGFGSLSVSGTPTAYQLVSSSGIDWSRNYITTAVPEPPTWAMLAVGIAFLTVSGRGKLRRRHGPSSGPQSVGTLKTI